jgi:hypothetical protein
VVSRSFRRNGGHEMNVETACSDSVKERLEMGYLAWSRATRFHAGAGRGYRAPTLGRGDSRSRR